ncbi:hypothetical protein [Moorena sp. SIO3A2]|uniref:hypothetical protein n=1 Tax=Moorena sp. SIO3A2 TaxID=2607841 RepID=UPI0013B6DDC5|nr:hypothetical protein [Moorena sp. SIO3A2]NER90369.1 hypothetical protein [Moorena sp. SIO3A2]
MTIYSDRDKVMELLVTLQTVASYYSAVKHEEQLIQWLEDTKGVFPNGDPFYRYYLVAAIFIETNSEVNILKQAEGGTVFTNFDRTAQTYRNLQWRIDGATDAEIPESLQLTYCDPCDNPSKKPVAATGCCHPVGSRRVALRGRGIY